MKVRMLRVYEVNFNGSTPELIRIVNRRVLDDTGSGLQELNLESTVEALGDYYDQGDFTDIVDVIAQDYDFMDCDDANRTLDWKDWEIFP